MAQRADGCRVQRQNGPVLAAADPGLGCGVGEGDVCEAGEEDYPSGRRGLLVDLCMFRGPRCMDYIDRVFRA